MKTPLHQQQPTTRFSDRAADYVRFRPTYPAEAIDAVVAGLGAPEGLAAADIGAGTGISARLLAERGVRVFAVEPNAAMRDAGRAATGGAEAAPSPCGGAAGVAWVDGTAESTTLPEASVDLVLCAQSYHWFEPGAACREFARILRPGARLALLWNDGDETTPVARGYYDLVRGASTGAGPSSHQTVAKSPPIAPPFSGASMRRLVFRNEQRLDADGLIGRAMSASYVVKAGPRAAQLLDGLRRLHAAHGGPDGRVGLVYAVWLYLLDRP